MVIIDMLTIAYEYFLYTVFKRPKMIEIQENILVAKISDKNLFLALVHMICENGLVVG